MRSLFYPYSNYADYLLAQSRAHSSARLSGEDNEEAFERENGSTGQEAPEAARGPQDQVGYNWPSLEDAMELSYHAVDNHQGFRDPGLIDAGIGAARNQQAYGGVNDPYTLAAHLINNIQRQQALVEGNKRTGTMLGLYFLEENGIDTTNLPQKPMEDLVVAMAEKQVSVEQVGDFLRQYLQPRLSRIARIEQAVDYALDSTGNKIPLGYYPGEELNAVDEHEHIVGSLLYRKLGDAIWVDSIYSTQPSQAIEMFAWIRSNFPGVQIEGRFQNKELQTLVERYNRRNGFEPWDDEIRWGEADNTYALMSARMGRTTSRNETLVNPMKWNPEREKAWLRAWEAEHEPWVSNDWTTAALHFAASVEELAQKMVDSLLNKPDIQKMKEYAEKDEARKWEIINWLNPLQPAIDKWLSDQNPHDFAARLTLDNILTMVHDWRADCDKERVDALYPRGLDVGKFELMIKDRLKEVRDTHGNLTDIGVKQYPAQFTEDPDIPTNSEKEWGRWQHRNMNGGVYADLPPLSWDDALRRTVSSYGWPGEISQKIPGLRELLPGDPGTEVATQALSNMIKTGYKKQERAVMPVIYKRIKDNLEEVASKAPEAFKMYPWMVKHMKNQMETNVRRDNIPGFSTKTVESVVEYGPMLKHYQDNHKLPKGFDLNRMTPDQFHDWAKDELVEPHEDESHIVFTYPDGWTIRELNSDYPDDFTSEGEEMGNCIRHYEDNGYGWLGKVATNYSHIFSLRTPKNRPKVSIDAVGVAGARDPEDAWPNRLTMNMELAYSNQTPSRELKDRLNVWYDTLRAKGIDVEHGSHDNEYQDEDEDEHHEPEHREDLDEYESNPEGDFDVDDLRSLREYGNTMRDNACQFEDSEESDTRELDNGDYYFIQYGGRNVRSEQQESNIAEEIGVEALESETEEDQKQIFKDLEHLHIMIAHTLYNGSNRQQVDPEISPYLWKDASHFDQDILAALQKVEADGKDILAAGLDSWYWNWEQMKAAASQAQAEYRGRGMPSWQNFIDTSGASAEKSDNKITQTGFKILTNAIAYWQKLSKELSNVSHSWPGDGLNADEWSGIKDYDQAREEHKAMLPRLPQYEQLAQPIDWSANKPEVMRRVDEIHPPYPLGPGGQQTFLEKPAQLPAPGVAVHPDWVSPLDRGADQMNMDSYDQNLTRTPYFNYAMMQLRQFPGLQGQIPAYQSMSPEMQNEITLSDWRTAWAAALYYQHLHPEGAADDPEPPGRVAAVEWSEWFTSPISS